MDLLQLRYFMDSAKNENFSKTAEKYMVPTSSVSASIKRLESELGIQLFDRKANKISLNEQGRIFANALTSAFEHAENAIAEIKAPKVPVPEISLLVRARRNWITTLLVQYKKLHPNVSFKMSHDYATTDFTPYDIVIGRQTDECSDWEHFLLSVDELCIKAHKDNPLTQKRLTMRNLCNEPFITMGKENTLHRLLVKHGNRCNFTPNVVIECADRDCLLHCVNAGMGLSLGTKKALKDDIQKELVALDVIDFCETQLVYVYHRQVRNNDDALKSFLEFLADVACTETK
ncbi:MAG: LysR family transcriptional regulator [Tyzzerella sp.]|nr:LysR family transcriptional regulator [Tyzzerella sp.]